MPSTELSGHEHLHPLVSVIIPVFSERSTLAQLVERVPSFPWPKEILLVDDGSDDGGVGELAHQPYVRVFVHSRNRAKGAAIRPAAVRSGADLPGGAYVTTALQKSHHAWYCQLPGGNRRRDTRRRARRRHANRTSHRAIPKLSCRLLNGSGPDGGAPDVRRFYGRSAICLLVESN
jgi:glycosyltransferase involved in cell wall biosynthesis